jgi:hypothetical protein
LYFNHQDCKQGVLDLSQVRRELASIEQPTINSRMIAELSAIQKQSCRPTTPNLESKCAKNGVMGNFDFEVAEKVDFAGNLVVIDLSKTGGTRQSGLPQIGYKRKSQKSAQAIRSTQNHSG